MKKLILKDFVLEEISGVDRPAQVGAKMSIIKRKRDDEGPDMSADKLKEMQEKIDGLNKALELSKALAALSDAEKQYMQGMSDEARDAFSLMKSDDRAAAMEMSKRADESIEIDGNLITKGAVGEEMFNVIKSQQLQIQKQAAETRKAREIAMQAGFVKKAIDSYSHVPGTSEEIGTLLRETADISKGAQATLSSVLVALEKHNTELFEKKGAAGGEDDAKSPTEKLDELAKAHAEKHNVDYATAYSSVIEKNADLYAKTIN
jgi:hypothetical protein